MGPKTWSQKGTNCTHHRPNGWMKAPEGSQKNTQNESKKSTSEKGRENGDRQVLSFSVYSKVQRGSYQTMKSTITRLKCVAHNKPKYSKRVKHKNSVKSFFDQKTIKILMLEFFRYQIWNRQKNSHRIE